MGIRKNAKFLTAAEKENFVRACVLMKADIVNPLAAAADRYSRWDQYAAIHWMIQQATAPPGAVPVNFGHGGSGAYSFLSWHRYFLYQFEKQLQSYVASVMLPYWDWTDPAPIMTDTFMGPNGTVSHEVRSGYFAKDAPATGVNPTPSPAWWPAGLTGWLLPASFGTASGALKRGLSPLSGLPTTNDLRSTLAKTAYPAFQNAIESGNGLVTFPSQQMHNGMHGWIGGAFGQMSNPLYAAFDPFFYLHHCNIDRLWAMWQADGHATDYPVSGGNAYHNRNDIMYPWVGATPGYGTTAGISIAIPMPDFSAIGIKRNVDTLDFRTAFGYTYDSIAVIGVGLDRTGSMNGLTPDPMTTGAPDVTKWEAAKRGVSAFLQDCETVQNSGIIYTVAGIETFRRLGAANDFHPVFASPGYGLIKGGTGFSKATFDSAAGAMSPGGDTPLADALVDVKNTLVNAPFGGVPADEQRYLAMLTDGLLTSGSPMSSIANGSFSPIAVFSMGFGTGAEVDYPTLQSMVDKGRTLSTQQLFHGENAGTIDKFYSNAMAAAIGFTSIFDPVMELFAGEYTHVEFQATSADDAFFISAQGMDFIDGNWSFHLHGPNGTMVYGEDATPMGGMDMGCMHCCRPPHVTANRSNGRLSLMLQRDSADADCWVGNWTLMASFKAKHLDAMVMFPLGNLMQPVAAGPARGPRYSRLLVDPKNRIAQRNVVQAARHVLDVHPAGSNHNGGEACDLAVNVYARTRLRYSLVASDNHAVTGKEVAIQLKADLLQGNVSNTRTFARMVSPVSNLAALGPKLNPNKISADEIVAGALVPKFDPAKALAAYEKRDPKLTAQRDEVVNVAVHDNGPMHVHIEKAAVAGPYHLSVYIEGDYCPDHDTASGHDHMDHAAMDSPPPAAAPPATPAAPTSVCGPQCMPERFTRLLTTMAAVSQA
ncbi:MAG TPA: tyrosinase family protein [Bryobacteraceae bacterium]